MGVVKGNAVKELADAKQQLEAMEYFEYLGVESLPLVRHLLSDLVLTTESHESYMSQAQELEKKLSKLYETITPLKRENERLVRENNQLHLQIIQTNEDADAREKHQMLQMQTTRDSLSKANFMAREWEKKYSNLVRSKGIQLPEAEEKNDHDVKAQLDEAKAQIAKLQSSLDAETNKVRARENELLRLGIELEKRSPNIDVQQARVQDLSDEVAFLKNKLSEQQQYIESVQVENARSLEDIQTELVLKNKELTNVRKQITMGSENVRPGSATMRKPKEKKKHNVETLESELVHREGAMQQTQQRLDEVTAALAKMESENKMLAQQNEELEDELRRAQNAVSESNQETEHSSALREHLGSLESTVSEYEQELQELRRNLEKERRQSQEQSRSFQASTSNVEALQRKVATLNDQVRQLQVENHSLKQENDASQRKVDNFLQDSISQRSGVQEVKNKLEATIAERDRAQARATALFEEVQTLTQKLSRASEQYHEEAGQRANLERLTSLPTVVSELEDQVERWRERAAALDVESKRLSSEVNVLKRELENSETERRSHSSTIQKLRSELDSVTTNLTKQGLRASELEVNVRTMTTEISALKSEIEHKDRLLANRHSNDESKGAELMRVQLEYQRTSAKSEAMERRIAVLEEQLRGAREQLSAQDTTSTAQSSQVTASRAEVARLQGVVKLLEEDLDQVRSQETQRSDELQVCEAKCRSLQNEIHILNGEKQKLTQSIDQFKSVFSKLDETRANLESRVKDLHTSLSRERAARDTAEQDLQRFNEAAHASAEKITFLERAVRDMEMQKSGVEKKLQAVSKAKIELENAVNAQEQSYRELEQQMGVTKHTLISSTQSLDSRDRDVERLEEQLRNAQRNIAQLDRLCKERGLELNNATLDLGNMTRENQSVNSACVTLRNERDKLRVQLSDALARASRLDGLLESAKMEKADLLAVYRRSCDEVTQTKRLLQELSNARAREIGNNAAQHEDSTRLRRRIIELQEAYKRQDVDLRASERMVSDLSRQLHVLQGQLEAKEEQHSVLKTDAQSAQDASIALVRREETLQWQLQNCQSQCQQLQERVGRYQEREVVLEKRLLETQNALRHHSETIAKLRYAQAESELMAQNRSMNITDSIIATDTTQKTEDHSREEQGSEVVDVIASELEAIISEQDDVIKAFSKNRRFDNSSNADTAS